MNRIPPKGIKCLREGFILYNIYLGEEKVGEATVKREGLYYHFLCSSNLPAGTIYCVILRCAEKEFNLGVCVPEGDLFYTGKRIPMKQFSNSDFQFCIEEKNKRPQKSVTVNPQRPIAYLEHLENAYFCSNNGTPKICIPEPIDLTLDQQDSDRSL